VNMALEKGERVTTEGKVRLEVKLERSLGWLHGWPGKKLWNIWWMTAGKVEVMPMLSGFDVGRSAEA
jgi:hypothetical protein